MTVRILGIETLTKVLNVKSNVKSFEELIYKISKKDDKLYKKLLYQLVYDISMNKSIKSLYIDLLDKNIEWNHPAFSKFKIMSKEQDDFMLNPFEIEEGVLECGKCKSKKTFSFTKQTRGADEGTTVFAQCAQCGNKWKM